MGDTSNERTNPSYDNTGRLNGTVRNKQFDVKKFNLDYDEYLKESTALAKRREEERLAILNKPPPKKKIYEMSVGEILVGIKDTWFEILDDLLQQNFTLDIFTRGNRLFFIGLTLVLIIIFVYLYNVFTDDDTPEQPKQLKEIHHIYHPFPHLTTGPNIPQPDPSKNIYVQAAKNVPALVSPLFEDSPSGMD